MRRVATGSISNDGNATTSNATTLRSPLRDLQLHDLAHDLIHATATTVVYEQLAHLIVRGPQIGAAPAGIAKARERLTDAAERGNNVAARLLEEVSR